MRKLAGLLSANPFMPSKDLDGALSQVCMVLNYGWRLSRNYARVCKVTCPDCESFSVFLDREAGEHICRVYGCVVERDNLVNTLPMDTTYVLVNHMAFGKSLGGTLCNKQICKGDCRCSSGQEGSAHSEYTDSVIANAMELSAD